MLQYWFLVASFFALFSPIILVGIFLDFHLRQPGQEKTKNYIGDLYLNASYGTLFREYCKFILKLLEKKIIKIYIFIFFAFVLTGFLAHYFIFRDFSFSLFLIKRYLLIATVLSFIGLIDFLIVKRTITLAANNYLKTALLISALTIYLLTALSGAALATFMLDGKLGLQFYLEFFPNRLWEMLKDPTGGAMEISSVMHGYYVRVSALAFPTVVISSSTLIAGIGVRLASSKRLHPLYDYLAERILSKDEKKIHKKLAIIFCGTISIIAAGIYSF